MITGIVTDNKKLKKFQRELEKDGFKYETKPFLGTASIIEVEHKESRLKAIEHICRKCNINAKRNN